MKGCKTVCSAPMQKEVLSYDENHMVGRERLILGIVGVALKTRRPTNSRALTCSLVIFSQEYSICPTAGWSSRSAFLLAAAIPLQHSVCGESQHRISANRICHGAHRSRGLGNELCEHDDE